MASVQVIGSDDTQQTLLDLRIPLQPAAVGWPLRKTQGKLLSVLRQLKALFTSEGGLDYIAWKLRRHSGKRLEIPGRVRR